MNQAPLFVIGACLLATATSTAIPLPGSNQPPSSIALSPGFPAPIFLMEQPQPIQDEQKLTPVTREKRENERVVFNDDSGLSSTTPCRNCGVSRIEYTEPVRTCRNCGSSGSRIEYTEQPVTSVRTCSGRSCGGGSIPARIEYTEPIVNTVRSCSGSGCGGGTTYYPSSVRTEVYSTGCRGGNCGGGTTYYPGSTYYTSSVPIRSEVVSSYNYGCRNGNCGGGTSYYPVRSGGYTCRNCA